MERRVGVSEIYVLYIIALVMLVATLWILFGIGAPTDFSELQKDTAKDSLEKFRDEDVEVGCEKEESYTTSKKVNFASQIETVYVDEGFYKAELTLVEKRRRSAKEDPSSGEGEKATVKAEVVACEEARICESGSGLDCSPGGEISGGIQNLIFHYSEGDSKVAIEVEEG